ncbi:hypothetical protein EDB84DRAFT_1579660 [Lactarius hengduanensis]|nr:hypothetical protein EDB84DRAFT_1579660 [Lactarius hengduanensis]
MSLMQNELERSVLSAQMLESSTASLKATSSTHDVLTGLLGTSGQLVTALEKADWLDWLLIFAALIFFVLVIFLILKQRIVDRGARRLLVDALLAPGRFATGRQGVGIADSVASSVVASVTTALASQVTNAAGSSGDPLSTSASGDPHATVDLGAVGSGHSTLAADILYSGDVFVAPEERGLQLAWITVTE